MQVKGLPVILALNGVQTWHLDFTYLSEMIVLNLNEASFGPPEWLCLLLVQRLCPSQSLLALVPLIYIPENKAAEGTIGKNGSTLHLFDDHFYHLARLKTLLGAVSNLTASVCKYAINEFIHR